MDGVPVRFWHLRCSHPSIADKCFLKTCYPHLYCSCMSIAFGAQSLESTPDFATKAPPNILFDATPATAWPALVQAAFLT